MSQTKRHHWIFEVSKGCVESHFPLIPLPDPDKMVGTSQVELGEEVGPVEQTKGSVQERERVPILNSDLIETLIVIAWPQGTILHLDKEKSCTDWRR